MKTLYIVIITILFVSVFASIEHVFADNDSTSHLNVTTDYGGRGIMVGSDQTVAPFLPSPPLGMYPYTSKIFSVFQIDPEIVHPNDTSAIHILVTNNANFTLYDVNLGESVNDSKSLMFSNIHKIDILNPNQTKTIYGILHVSSDARPTDYYDIWWNVVAKNQTGMMMESMQFHRNLPITQSLSRYCCDKPVTITLESPLKQFKHGTVPKDVTCWQGFQLIFKSEDGSPACVRPDTATKLELRGWAYQEILSKNKLYEGFTSTNTNQTLMIGTDMYDVREFSPVAGNTVYLDDMKFVYEGRSPLNNSCYPELVNQTQARDFEIVSNETDMHAHYCWPPTNYPQNMTKQNVFPHDLFSKYSIGFFDNQTMGIGWCHLDSCEFGKMFYLVKKGWNTPIVYDSPSNLEFHLTTNASVISSVQAIGIDMSTSNKLSNTIMVPNKYDFSFEGTGLGPCYYGPFRLGIFKGYFDENNFTKGTELKMYPPGMYSCAAPSPAKGYKFEPKSETSTPRCSPFEYCTWIEQMQDHVFFSGYWEDAKFHKFESGTYTIIAGDEWRNHSIKHFTVSQNG